MYTICIQIMTIYSIMSTSIPHELILIMIAIIDITMKARGKDGKVSITMDTQKLFLPSNVLLCQILCHPYHQSTDDLQVGVTLGTFSAYYCFPGYI